MSEKILVINPGSTSTKIAVYDGTEKILQESIDHQVELIESFEKITDQLDMRTKIIEESLAKHNFDEKELNGIMGRGGLLPNVESGGYAVNDEMVTAFMDGYASPHASNLGALISHKMASTLNIPCYIMDCVTSNEWDEISTISGSNLIKRTPANHVLNQKAVARKVAEKHGKKYEDMNFVVAHMGGGVSCGAHKHGKIVDSMRDDEGAFSPERTGGLPLLYFLELCYSGEYTKKEVKKLVRGKGGVNSYLGTTDMRDVEKMVEDGDEKATLILDAFCYQISKAIAGMSIALSCDVDYIVLTGGIAYSKYVTDYIIERVNKIAPVEIVAGEDEMGALCNGCLRMLRGEEQPKEYKLPEKKGKVF